MSLYLRNRSADGQWGRWPLPDDGCTIVCPAGIESAGQHDPEAILIPDHALGAIVQTGGRAYHVARQHVLTFKNAERQPVAPVSEIRAGDRLTYHGAGSGGGGPVRVWYLWEATASPGAACGYCRQAISAAEPASACPACGETVHQSCQNDGGNRCPHCNGELLPLTDMDNWRPDGFADTEDADDSL